MRTRKTPIIKTNDTKKKLFGTFYEERQRGKINTGMTYCANEWYTETTT